MQLTAGTRLGPYEVLSPLGSGGMGEVYAARDTRLDRRVAIKISKAQFSERFEREARAVAALNHPHICQLYDVGPNYLVMELVEGTPVGPVADLRQLLELAAQIADGLAAAHAVGIVHRDIKPSNLLVTSSGHVKILDFGLATVMPTSTAASDVTRGAVVTEAGTLIGTAAYMSPEQARGEALDARTDLWSFGVVLYEMSTAARPFEGRTSAVVFEELLSKTPLAVRQRNAKIPADLERVIERLLEKDRETRYQSAADVRADLKRIGRSGEQRLASSTRAPAGAWTRHRTATIVVASLVAMFVLAAIAWRLGQMGTSPVTSPSEYVQLTDFSDSVIDPGLSSDGRMVTFIRSDSAFPWIGEVYVKLLSGGDAVRLTNGAAPRYAPVFTPDGSRVAYTQLSRVEGRSTWDTWTVPIGGGEPTRMLPNAAGLVWIDNQHVLFSEIKGTGLHMGIVTATVSRSEQREIYFPGHERAMAHYSYLSPDRRWVLISEMDRTTAFQPCRLTSFDGSSPGKQVGPPGACTATAWSPDGRWMYFSVSVAGASHLWRQRFPDGRPEQLTFGPGEEFGVSVAADGGSLITAVGQQRSAIWIHDEKGERQVTTEGVAHSPKFSRDGQRLYYLLRENAANAATSELRSMELSSGRTDRLLPDRSVTQYAISPEDREVAFTTETPAGVPEVWVATLDRSAPPRRVVQSADSVSFAGTDLIFRSLESTVNFLSRIRKDGSERRRVMETPVLGVEDVSPDGKWATVGAPGAGATATPGPLLVSLENGTSRPLCNCRARWSPDGRWMYVFQMPTPGNDATKSIAIPLGATQEPPALSSTMLGEAMKGIPPAKTRLINQPDIAPGRDPSLYAFTKRDMQRNLYRIPLH
ncbi:MAG TPA: protein kinase [Vicinamibacterales bacterium]|nr:protein kinase [Vicinamibacterales bacterium]